MKDLLERVVELQAPVNQDQVSSMVQYIGTSHSIKTLEAVVKHYKDQLREIVTKDLLEWMNENDQQAFETEDGTKVSIRTSVSAKVMNTDSAFSWLIKNQYGDLIKDTLEFPKGELTTEATAALEEMGLSYTQKSGIHPMSLKKIMKERLNDSEDLPEETDGIQVGYFDECVVKG